MARICYLIAYDIADDKRRSRLRKALRAHSLSYQDSFFEVMMSQSEIKLLLERLTSLIEPEEDRLLCLKLSKGFSRWQLGSGHFSPDGPLYVIR